jgi:hypothetical protein
MTTLLNILDLAVLLLLIVHLTRTVGVSGSVLLTILVGLVVTVFAIVSLGAYVGLVSESSLLTRLIFLLVLVAMVSVIRSSWKSKPAT